MHVQIDRIEGRRFAIRARGVETVVDDTVENGGPGDGFRPTELLLAGLGACMMGTMITFAKNEDIPIGDVSMYLEDETERHPDRIGTIRITMDLATTATDKQIASLKRVAAACKVHNTLERPPHIEFEFQTATV